MNKLNRPELLPGHLHLWQTRLNITSDRRLVLWQLLSSAEKERANRFYFERDRLHYIAARGQLRKLLGVYLDQDPARLEFDYAAQGKPFLVNPGLPLQFNLSHSHELAVIGVTLGRPLGVDVEQLRPVEDFDTIAAQFFSPTETAAIRALPPDQRNQGFFNAWTRKEAYLKATGSGLSRPLSEIEVSVQPDEPARFLRDLPELVGWSLVAFEPTPGYIAAVTLPGPIANQPLECWLFDIL